MEPKTAQTWSWTHKRHQKYLQGRFRTEVITLEEAAWLIIGLVFGWFAAKGANIFLLLIPIVILLVWLYEQFYASKHGLRYITNALTNGRRR